MLLSFADTLNLEQALHQREKEEALEREESLRRLGLVNPEVSSTPETVDEALRRMGRRPDIDGERDVMEEDEEEDGDYDFKERFGSHV